MVVVATAATVVVVPVAVAAAVAGRGIADVIEMALVAIVAVALPIQDMALLAIAETVGATVVQCVVGAGGIPLGMSGMTNCSEEIHCCRNQFH